MSCEQPNAGTGQDASRPQWLTVDFWSGRRLAIAALVACAIAYLIWRGAPAVGFILIRLRDVCVTIILAVLLAYVVVPLVDGFCTFRPFAGSRVGRIAATLVVFVLLTIGVSCLAVLTADPIITETARLVRLVEGWLEDAPVEIERLLSAYAAAVPPDVANVINQRVSDIASEILGGAGTMAVGVVLRGWYVVEALLVPVLAFYFVTDSERLMQSVLRAVPDKHHDRFRQLARDVDRTMHGYVRGQLILCLIAAVVTSAVLYLLDVRVFLTLGLVAGLTRAIPIIGPIVGGVVISGIAWLQVDIETALIALAIFCVMHFVESKLIMPKVLGHEAELHPVLVIIALLVGGEFFGVLGMLVAVPIVAALRVGFLHWRAAREGTEAALA
jgi:predicted PurR-regulated permease PerM